MSTEQTNVKPTGRVVRERFSRENPFHIAKRMPPDEESPSGWVLGWKSERLRNGSGMGWGNWEPAEYGAKWVGENGEKLKEFIPNPPRRMRGPDQIDNLVRRADVILCRIPADEFDENQMAGVLESQARVSELAVPEGVELAPNVMSVGGGLKKDRNPTFGNGTDEDKALGEKLRKHSK